MLYKFIDFNNVRSVTKTIDGKNNNNNIISNKNNKKKFKEKV